MFLRETKGEAKKRGRVWGKGEGVFVLEGTKGLPLDEEETDMVQSQMAVYKGEKRNPKLVSEVFDFAWTG